MAVRSHDLLPGLALLVVGLVVIYAVSVARPAGSDRPITSSDQHATPAASAPQNAPGATGAVPTGPLTRSVTPVGSGVAASGDFRGSGKSQIALLQDPTGDLSLRVSVLDAGADGDSFTAATWLTTGPNSFSLTRAKFAVADVTFDGRDDLVALYDDGGTNVRLLVFTSTGSGFSFTPDAWWRSDGYAWSRSRNVIAGNFAASGRDGLLVTYQYDDFDMRIHYFESTGSAFAFGGTDGVYHSGPGQYDTARARFTTGHFTRTGGPNQIASFYQYPNLEVRIHLFDPSPTGLVPLNGWVGAYSTGEGVYDLNRAAISAADVTADGRDDLVSLYSYADGSARVHVFDPASSFKPVNEWTGWASVPASSLCAGGSGLVVGDWNGDRKADANALTPAVSAKVRSNTLRNLGGSFKLTSSAEEPSCSRWPLTGMPANGGNVTLRPLYVKVDNNPTARPHYGIAKADQVYEWLVEGFTTRLAAVFHSQTPNEIGSVRSARMTDVPIVPSLSGALVYSGAAAEELMRMNYDDQVAHRYIDLSPRYGWGYRVGFRPAPYNYFTTLGLLRETLAAAPDGTRPVNVAPWNFLPTSTGDPVAGGFNGSVPATTVAIPYRALFGVRYEYDAGSRSYARFDDGVREIDGATREPIAARNIVVIQTDVHFTTEWGVDAAGSPKLDMKLTGTGQGSVFRDGRRQDVVWTRPDIFDVFTLKTRSGEVVQLSPGQTWIHVVPTDWVIPST